MTEIQSLASSILQFNVETGFRYNSKELIERLFKEQKEPFDEPNPVELYFETRNGQRFRRVHRFHENIIKAQLNLDLVEDALETFRQFQYAFQAVESLVDMSFYAAKNKSPEEAEQIEAEAVKVFMAFPETSEASNLYFLITCYAQTGSFVGRIRKNHLQSLETFFQCLGRQFGTILVLNVSRMNHQRHNETKRINNSMSFSTVHSFGGIITTWSSAFRRFHRLTVDDTDRRCWLFALVFPDPATQSVMNFLPNSTVTPMPKYIIDSLPLRETVGDVSPLAPGPHHVKDGVNNTSAVNLFRDQFLDDFPLLECQICPIMGQNSHVTFLRD